MIYGELVQRWRLSKGVKLLKWPHDIGAHSARQVAQQACKQDPCWSACSMLQRLRVLLRQISGLGCLLPLNMLP